jgi:hypothetical protein
MSYVSPQSLKDILNGPHEYVNGTYRPLPPKPAIEPPAPQPQGSSSKEFAAYQEKNKKSKE